MTAPIASIHADQIKALLAEKGYEVTEPTPGVLRIQELHSGVAVQAVLESDILYLSLTCTVILESDITPQMMRSMLDAHNGISTSYFQLYDAGDGNVAVTLNNFCRLEDLGTEDQDTVIACVHSLRVFTLAPGDGIATGAPSGVGFARKPPCELRSGGEVVVHVGGVGERRNPVAEE